MMLKKWTRTVALLLAVLFCLNGCSKAEKVDYDTTPLSFETVFDDTPGNPDKPDTIFVETRYNALPAHRVRVYEFEEDTICKGAFYVLPSDYSYDLPEEGIIKGVFTYDYTKQGNGLRIHRFLSFDHGGGQQIAARIAYNELDMVLCFSDPNQKIPDEDVANIFRLCDQNNIPYASNVATAEMLVLGLARGDLAWRDIVNPKTKPFTA